VTAPHVAGFAAAVVPIMLTPGVSVTLVTQRTLRDGPTAGLRVAAGTACGLSVHATAAALGLAAIVARSATAFTVLKLAGAAYLIAMGLAALRGARAGAQRPQRRLPWTGHGPFREALLSNVLNPRAASVYLTLVPQFVGPGDDVLVATAELAGVHIVLQTVWLATCTMAVARARTALARSWVRRRAQALSGGVLVGLGVRTAVQGRS